MTQTKQVSVCGVPYEMSIVDGGVLFSDKAGFYGITARYMWEYRGMLWYLVDVKDTFGKVPGVHLVKMHQLLEKYVGPDHTEADGSKFTLSFKEEPADRTG